MTDLNELLPEAKDEIQALVNAAVKWARTAMRRGAADPYDERDVFLAAMSLAEIVGDDEPQEP